MGVKVVSQLSQLHILAWLEHCIDQSEARICFIMTFNTRPFRCTFIIKKNILRLYVTMCNTNTVKIFLQAREKSSFTTKV